VVEKELKKHILRGSLFYFIAIRSLVFMAQTLCVGCGCVSVKYKTNNAKRDNSYNSKNNNIGEAITDKSTFR